MMVQRAEAEFHVLVAQFLNDHNHLTDIELATIMLIAPPIPLRMALRIERHGTTDKEADEE